MRVKPRCRARRSRYRRTCGGEPPSMYTSLYGTSVWAKMLSRAGRVTRNCSRGATTTVVRVSVTSLSAASGWAPARARRQCHQGELHRLCQGRSGGKFNTCGSAGIAHLSKCKGSRHKWVFRRDGELAEGRKAERRWLPLESGQTLARAEACRTSGFITLMGLPPA